MSIYGLPPSDDSQFRRPDIEPVRSLEELYGHFDLLFSLPPGSEEYGETLSRVEMALSSLQQTSNPNEKFRFAELGSHLDDYVHLGAIHTQLTSQADAIASKLHNPQLTPDQIKKIDNEIVAIDKKLLDPDLTLPQREALLAESQQLLDELNNPSLSNEVITDLRDQHEADRETLAGVSTDLTTLAVRIREILDDLKSA